MFDLCGLNLSDTHRFEHVLDFTSKYAANNIKNELKMYRMIF